MFRTSALIGRLVISSDVERGVVADILIDSEHACAEALVTDGSGGKRVVPYDSVETLGPGVVIIRQDEVGCPLSEWMKDVRGLKICASRLTNRRVITQAGRDVGAIRDVRLDREGRIEGYDVSQRFQSGIGSYHQVLPHTDAVHLQEDMVLIEDAVVASMSRAIIDV